MPLFEFRKYYFELNNTAPGDHYIFVLVTLTQHDMEQSKYTGMWVTADGHIRQELLPAGRYDEARGSRKSAYTGRYKITGDYIYYWDDTGFTADGNFADIDTLHHGGYIFYREKK